MSVLSYDTHGTTAVITLTNGENRQNPTFAAEMLAALDRAEADRSVRALVLTADDPKNWSQGVDLNFLNSALKDQRHDEIKAFMHDMNRVFARLLTIPVPVIAAITGHAFGNGVMLAAASDFRFMRADRGYFCLPEVDISIPLMPGMIALVKTALPYHLLNELMLTGRRVTADELERLHVITRACPDAETTLAAAMDYAAGFSKARGVLGEHKRRMHGHILQIQKTEDTPLIERLQLMS